MGANEDWANFCLCLKPPTPSVATNPAADVLLLACHPCDFYFEFNLESHQEDTAMSAPGHRNSGIFSEANIFRD